MEAFFLAIGFYFEPCYARARNIYAKLTSIIGLLDDTYDAYGTYEELQCFTDAMQRLICLFVKFPFFLGKAGSIVTINMCNFLSFIHFKD